VKIEEEALDGNDEDLPLVNGEEPERESGDHPGSLCRLCAEPVGATPEYLFRDSNLADIINFCLPVFVSKNDVLPKQVCSVCCQRVFLQRSFAEACVEAEKKLVGLAKSFL